MVLSTSAASPIPDPSEQLRNKVKDFRDLQTMLDSLFFELQRHSHPNSIGCWAEKDWFIYCFVSVALLSYDDYVDRIKGHPFFMDAVDMMTYVEDLHNCIHRRTVRSKKLELVLSFPHFDRLLNWNENSKMKKWKYYMRCIYAYKNSDYSGGTAIDLLRFICNTTALQPRLNHWMKT